MALKTGYSALWWSGGTPMFRTKCTLVVFGCTNVQDTALWWSRGALIFRKQFSLVVKGNINVQHTLWRLRFSVNSVNTQWNELTTHCSKLPDTDRIDGLTILSVYHPYKRMLHWLVWPACVFCDHWLSDFTFDYCWINDMLYVITRH